MIATKGATLMKISSHRHGKLSQSWKQVAGVGVLCLTVAVVTPSAGLGAPPDQLTAGPSAQWVAKPPLGQARAGLGVAKVGNEAYAVAGRAVDDHMYDNVESRKLSGPGEWATLAPLPAARGNVAVAALGGKVYTIGGNLDPFTSTGQITAEVDRYNPATRQWSQLNPLPQPRFVAGAASLHGVLYVAGGVVELPDGTAETTNTVLAYNATADEWHHVAPLLSARDGHRLVAAGPYLYAIGGAAATGESLASVERYDPKANVWTEIAPMNESRWLPCAVETRVGSKHLIAVVAGGEFLPGFELVDGRRTTEVLDLETGQWILLDVLLPFVRASLDCVTKPNGNILAIGGGTHESGSFTYLADVDELALSPRDLR